MRVADELMEKIEGCGYLRTVWAVKGKSKRPKGVMSEGLASISELIKMAEEILQSGTIHSSSLAMIIISLKAASADNTDSGSVNGIYAINDASRLRIMG